MDDKQHSNPICPKCGCPARSVSMRTDVVFDLAEDGSVGKVTYVDKHGLNKTFMCGGEHKFKVDATETKPFVETIRRSSGLIEHVCEHGVGHPAYGSVLFMSEENDDGYRGIHGCDGCCGNVEWQLADAREGLEIATQHFKRALKQCANLRKELEAKNDVG